MRNMLRFCYVFAALSGMYLLIQGCEKSDSGGDPVLPNVAVSAVTLNEGTGENTSFVFQFFLSSPSTQVVSIKATLRNGLAIAGSDFTAPPVSTISFSPGETLKTLTVSVIGDQWKEATEDFYYNLTDPVNCTLRNSFVGGFITNDDTEIFFEDKGYTTPTSYPGYTLTWSDEFDGTSLNLRNWNLENGDGCPNLCGWGNNELQWYTRGDNSYVQRGKLIIEARKELKFDKNYTSARLTTQDKKEFQYGRIDVRAKIPYGKGIWPAIWMLGTNIKTVSWPQCGELDIMESLGQEPNKVYATAHYASVGGPKNISKSLTATTPFSDEFHVYSLIWEKDKVVFLVDDKPINEIKKSDIAPSDYPFNAPFFFIINIAVGGNWPGSPDDTTPFPQWLFVDYVRVFQ